MGGEKIKVVNMDELGSEVGYFTSDGKTLLRGRG